MNWIGIWSWAEQSLEITFFGSVVYMEIIAVLWLFSFETYGIFF